MWNKVLVIGAGGTGSMLFVNLARYLRSIKFTGQLIIADGDLYSENNLERQNSGTAGVNRNKAEYQASLASYMLQDFADNIMFVDKYLSQSELQNIITNGTIVFNCVDNMAARKYVEDIVDSLQTAAHICCGNELRDGQVQLSHKINNERITPSLYRDSPNFNSTNDDRSTMTCEDIAKLPSGGQIIATNMMAASIALNFAIQILGNQPLHKGGTNIPSSHVIYDVFTNKMVSKK